MLKHGHTRSKGRSKEYAAWQHMMQRCYRKTHPDYKNYGGRGITVCDRWHIFENFLQDVGFAPTQNHTVDRYPNNNGNYEPSNFRWATRAEQNENRRVTRIYSHNGTTKTLTEWGKFANIPKDTLRYRLKKGWDFGTAITTPSQQAGYKLKTGSRLLKANNLNPDNCLILKKD